MKPKEREVFRALVAKAADYVSLMEDELLATSNRAIEREENTLRKQLGVIICEARALLDEQGD